MENMKLIIPTLIGLTLFVSSVSAQTKVKVSDFAGKSMQQVEKVLGKSTAKESVKPSRTPCPCDKLSYRNGQVQIVFMNGKADWITVNLPPSQVDTSGSFLSVSKFDNYVYVKKSTD
jgi:hypothetical protein